MYLRNFFHLFKYVYVTGWWIMVYHFVYRKVPCNVPVWRITAVPFVTNVPKATLDSRNANVRTLWNSPSFASLGFFGLTDLGRKWIFKYWHTMYTQTHVRMGFFYRCWTKVPRGLPNRLFWCHCAAVSKRGIAQYRKSADNFCHWSKNTGWVDSNCTTYYQKGLNAIEATKLSQ